MTSIEATFAAPALAAAAPALIVVTLVAVLTLATLGLLLARGLVSVVRFLLTPAASWSRQQPTNLRLISRADRGPRHQQDDDEELPRAA